MDIPGAVPFATHIDSLAVYYGLSHTNRATIRGVAHYLQTRGSYYSCNAVLLLNTETILMHFHIGYFKLCAVLTNEPQFYFNAFL